MKTCTEIEVLDMAGKVISAMRDLKKAIDEMETYKLTLSPDAFYDPRFTAIYDLLRNPHY